MNSLENVSVTVTAKANIYFDGKCVSHTLVAADGSRKSVGVIFPSSLTFNTGAPETMEIVGGRCRVRLPGATAWREIVAGERFDVAANASFDIETIETVDYICHFN
ncbi:MAG: hypothetical protein JWR40_1581 [Massilia sp.]|jgi:uncharacterized protein YaiE (UPF0345 family)|nr:hypothetical protein [Massilia sp.]MDB5949071.1 hypothetical protein [Massilia sp.]